MRGIAIEDRLLTEQHEGLQRKKAFETGLLLAQLGGKVDTVLRFIPTPQDPDGKPGDVNTNWLLEHAKQVARMLPGGIGILGCYAFASGAKLPALETKLHQVVGALSKLLPPTLTELQAVLLLLPSDSKKSTCRALPSGSSRLQPVELKPTHAAPQLVCFACHWAVDLTLSLSGDRKPHASQLAAQIGASEAALDATLATVDGQLLAPGLVASQLPVALGTLQEPHAVTFFATASPAATATVADAAALVRIIGTVHGRAFAFAKSEVEGAIKDLRRDVVGSLSARIPLLLESLEEDEGEDEADGKGATGGSFGLEAAAAHPLPRRAHVDVGSGLSLCDYLTSEEEYSDCAERFRELLNVALPEVEEGSEEAEALLGPEAVASAKAVASAEAAATLLLSSTTAGTARSASSATAAPASTTGSSPSGVPGKLAGGRLLPLAALAFGLLAVGLAVALSLISSDGSSPSATAGGGAAADIVHVAAAEAMADGAGAGSSVEVEAAAMAP